MPAAPPLTNLQRELLDLFALDLPEDELREIQRLLARHFAEKATASFDAFADEQGLPPEDTDRWAYEHARASAPSGEGRSHEVGQPSAIVGMHARRWREERATIPRR